MDALFQAHFVDALHPVLADIVEPAAYSFLLAVTFAPEEALRRALAED